MAVIHIPEEEATKDLKALLARVAQGDEFVIDGATTSFRLVPSTPMKPRTGAEMLEILANLPGERGVMDEDFARDVRSFREGHPESLDSSRWD
jgi:antitoxin (DNA-binding transcriptional repressor) of toxin-antitoxin stability system